MIDQLPAIIPLGALTTPSDTHIVPALIADLGEQASWRYVEFFTANINNDHTRRAYGRWPLLPVDGCLNPPKVGDMGSAEATGSD
jgi:hypothetical protein